MARWFDHLPERRNRSAEFVEIGMVDINLAVVANNMRVERSRNRRNAAVRSRPASHAAYRLKLLVAAIVVAAANVWYPA